jgi:hypothetical protein
MNPCKAPHLLLVQKLYNDMDSGLFRSESRQRGRDCSPSLLRKVKVDGCLRTAFDGRSKTAVSSTPISGL